jgi:DNA helicase-2/ATP-dependent DNA helicase PcrA
MHARIALDHDGRALRALMAQAMETAGVSLRELKPRRGSDPVGAFLQGLARVRAALEPPDQVEVTLECVTAEPLVTLPFGPVHAQFTRAQRATGTQSFDDQIYFAVADMLGDPAHRAFIQQRFDHVLVDEFQDLNGAQLALVDVLSRPHRSLFVVGDDDQLIYGWRQADPRGILEFHTRMPPRPFSATYTLGTNYRCSRAVVETGARLVAHNEVREAKEIHPRTGAQDGAVRFFGAPSWPERAAAMCAFLTAEKERLGCDWRDLAVLCRYRSQQLLVALALDGGGIPRTPALGSTLFTHPAATLLRAYLDLVRAPDELTGPALAGLLNRPNRYLSSRVVEAAGTASRPWAHVREAAALEPSAGSRPLSTLVELVAAAREQTAATSEDLVWTIVETFGLDDLWAAEADAAAAAGAPSDGAGPLEVFDSLLLLAETYPDPEAYLRTWDRLRADEEVHIGVADDTLAREESEEDRVVIVTIHAAKGREYHSVVIPDYDCDVSRWSALEVEEERRVVYVGVTRARDAVLFTVDTSAGFVHPFLRELVEPPEPCEHETLSAWLAELPGTPDDALRPLIADRLAEIGVLFPELVPEPATHQPPDLTDAVPTRGGGVVLQ